MKKGDKEIRHINGKDIYLFLNTNKKNMLTHHIKEIKEIISPFLVSVPTLLSSVFLNVIALYEDRNSLKNPSLCPLH